MSSLDKFRKNSATNFERLQKELEKVTSKGGGGKEDKRFWKLTRDKAGNGSAIIRFLPEQNPEAPAFVRYWDHGFKGPTGLWYIEKNLNSIGQDDPVSEMNRKLYQLGGDNKESAERKQASAQKRRLKFVSNILVIQDKANPENEGKVFLFQYGKKIFDLLNAKMHPEFEDEKQINPFDLWEGVNLRLRCRIEDKWPSWDRSEFDRPAPVTEDDAKLEKIADSLYSLKEFTDPANYKSYAELQARLSKVLGLDAPTESRARAAREEPKPSASRREAAPDMDDEDDMPWEKPAPKGKASASAPDDEDDDLQDFFSKLGSDE